MTGAPLRAVRLLPCALLFVVGTACDSSRTLCEYSCGCDVFYEMCLDGCLDGNSVKPVDEQYASEVAAWGSCYVASRCDDVPRCEAALDALTSMRRTAQGQASVTVTLPIHPV